jgi:hypothetical protein
LATRGEGWPGSDAPPGLPFERAADRRRSREAGFEHHLVKPADPVLLQTLITRPAEAPA